MRQPTLTQMEFVKPAGRKLPPLPEGWQRNTSEATGDSFYVHVASGRIVWKYGDMEKSPILPITPSRRATRATKCEPEPTIGPAPNNPFSGAVVDMYSTPRRQFRYGTSKKPIQLDTDDEVSTTSEAFSDMTNSQLVEKGPRKRLKLPAKTRVVYKDTTQNSVVLDESGFGSDSDSQSPPASFSQNYLRDDSEAE
jgi:hypothetical protein